MPVQAHHIHKTVDANIDCHHDEKKVQKYSIVQVQIDERETDESESQSKTFQGFRQQRLPRATALLVLGFFNRTDSFSCCFSGTPFFRRDDEIDTIFAIVGFACV
jgi:hypothetical protein